MSDARGMWVSTSTTSTTWDPKYAEWAATYTPEPVALERATLEHSDVELMAHPASECAGQSACPLHNRSVHPMRAMTQTWRDDRGIIERACEHGVSHPDPDQYPHWLARMGKKSADAMMVHGCCGKGCCA